MANLDCQLAAVRLWLDSHQPDRAKVQGISRVLASPEYVDRLLGTPRTPPLEAIKHGRVVYDLSDPHA